MRVDKFLKVSRLIKRREVAKELCDDGDVWINGKTAKPSSEIAEGDELKLGLGRHLLTIRVLSVRPYASKADAQSMYRIEADETLA